MEAAANDLLPASAEAGIGNSGGSGRCAGCVLGATAGGQFVEHHAEGVDVRGDGSARSTPEFGSEVVRGTGDTLLSRLLAGRDAFLGEAEVHDNSAQGAGSVPGDEDVAGLEVAVEEVLIVGGLEPGADLESDGQGFGGVRWT